MGRKLKEKIVGQSKKMSIFDWIKEIQTTKRPWNYFNETDKNEFNPYMVCKFLSMNPDFVQLVNFVQKIPYDKEKYYNIFKEFIPQGYSYSPYIKSKKEEVPEIIISSITKYYECSFKEAIEYISLLGVEGVQEILQAVGIDEKQIKKLIK